MMTSKRAKQTAELIRELAEAGDMSAAAMAVQKAIRDELLSIAREWRKAGNPQIAEWIKTRAEFIGGKPS